MIIKVDTSVSLFPPKFQMLLGALNYIMERERPDVNFAVNLLSRHTLSATMEKYQYHLVCILKYL